MNSPERSRGSAEHSAFVTFLVVSMIVTSCTPESNEQVVLEPTQTKTLEVVPTETVIPPTPTVKVEEETQETKDNDTKEANTLEALIKELGLEDMEEVEVEYKREGKILITPLYQVSKEDLKGNSFGFQEEDEDIYLLSYGEEEGWYIDTQSYPEGKENQIEEIFRWIEGRVGKIILKDNDSNTQDIFSLTFTFPEPEDKQDGDSGGDGDSCPADRQKPDGGCCAEGEKWSDTYQTCVGGGPT